ncbi:hypothetical protein EDB85DRAFT_162236 [Lactarius pseudohatsudake]|nr:hypothetical protein EDB85DRAFT_162236 [Lactarius pseudohatsudake]
MSTFNNVSGPTKCVTNADESNLFPILPSAIRDSRYPGTRRVRRVSQTIIPPGAGFAPQSEPSYQSQGWTISAHPEGNHYAYTTAPLGITIVTEAHIVEPGVSDQLNAWLAIICNVITERHIHLPETSHLFLEIHQNLYACNYYFVDHALRTVFWLHTLDINGTGPPRFFSGGHLHHSLQENYWIHIELFPQTASKYSAVALNELYIILLHVRTDAFSLQPPAFPYTVKQCEVLIDILGRRKVDQASSPHTTIYVARLWATVARHRSFIHFGSKRCLILTVVSKVLLFGLPDEYRAHFVSLCTDRLICTSHWRKHVSDTVVDLKQEISRMLALLSANIFMLRVSSLPSLTKVALMLCVLGLAVALTLLQEQRRLVSTKATASAVHLDDWITSYGFQLIAIVHSLPQALFIWALILFTIPHLWMAFFAMPLTFLLSVSPLVAVVLLTLVVCARI